MGNGSIDLPALLVEVVPAEIPVKNWFEQFWFAPEHRPGWEAKPAVSFDVVEFEPFEEGACFAVVAILVSPAGIMLDAEAESVIFNRIYNSCLSWLKRFEIGGCNNVAANQVVQAVKKPAAECIAVRAFFGVKLQDEVVVEDLILEANDKWGDVASDVAEGSNFDFMCIINSCENGFQRLDWIFLCGNEDVNARGYVLQVSGNCFGQFRVEDVQENANFFILKLSENTAIP